jgi:outer membrane protein
MKVKQLLILLASLQHLPVQIHAAEIDDRRATDATVVGNTLEDFFTAAINNNPDLNIARERWNIGTARKNGINGQLLPQISASATLSDNDSTEFGSGPQGQDLDSSFDGERYSVQVRQVLFNWQAFAARSQAYLLEDQSEAEYYAQLAQLLTLVADLYLSVLQAEDALISVNSEIDAMTNQINQIETLYNLQLMQITDLYTAQARQAAILAERVELESMLALSREALRAETGIVAGNLSRLPDLITVQPLVGTLDEWMERAAENNKIIEARGYALQAANKGISRQRGAYLPQVSLVFQHQNSNLGFLNSQIRETETNYIGLDFTVPIFAGGTSRAGVREAVSMRNIAANELRQAETEITQNARTAYLQVKSGEARIDAGRILVDSTVTSFDAMQRGFELGTVTSVDVLNALRDRFLAQRDLQQARYDHIRANLILRREAGTLTAQDLIDVSGMLNQTVTPEAQ